MRDKGLHQVRFSTLGPYFRKAASFASLILIALALSIFVPRFRTLENLLTIALQVSVISILSIGMVMIIISGGIDLSVGSVLALAGVATSMLLSHYRGIEIAVVLGIVVGGVCGCTNGVLTAKGKLPPFIATLGMMGIARGVALIVTDGVPIFGLLTAFSFWGGGRVLGIPFPVILTLLLAIIGHVLMTNTPFGRYTYAVGSNYEAVRLSGVNVDRHLIKIYTVAGLLFGLAGTVLTSRLSTGQPTAGTGYELDVIAACVIGGASLSGGEGAIPGAIVGSLLIGVLRNGCNLLNISAFWQQVAIGALIIIAVFVDQHQKRKGV